MGIRTLIDPPLNAIDLLTRQMYNECVRKLSNGKSPGEDNITNTIIKLLPEETHSFLFDYMRMCWLAKTTPTCWKETTTVMIHKKDDPHVVGNYRPIGLTNTLGKLHTAIIARILITLCECGDNPILSNSQSGSREQKSCISALQYLSGLAEDSHLHDSNLYLCYIDLKAAYPSVQISRLCEILHKMQLPEDIIAIIKDLYVHATTTLRLPTGMTDKLPIKCGLIQGDSLSPILFLLRLALS